MAESVRGLDALKKRLEAIGDPHPLGRALQLNIIAEAQKEAAPFRKTGELQRGIGPGDITDDRVEIVARAPHSAFVEKGTGLYGPHKRKIVPKKSKVLAWRTGATRLTGRSRVSGGRELAGWAFAASVKGRKATPFLLPSAKKVLAGSGLANIVVDLWNRAA